MSTPTATVVNGLDTDALKEVMATSPNRWNVANPIPLRPTPVIE